MHLELLWKRKILNENWTWPQITCFNFFGFWTDNVKIPDTKRRFLNYYRLYNILSCTLMFISVVISTDLKFRNGDILEGLFVIFTVAPILLGVIKMIQADRHMKTFQVAMTSIDELNKNTTHHHETLLIKKTVRRTWMIFIVSISFSSFAGLHWLIKPVFDIILYNEKNMVIDSWPDFTNSWSFFIPAYANQILLLFCLANFYIVFDDLFFSISEFILCHFDILEIKLRNLLMIKGSMKTLQLIGIVDIHVQLFEICKNLKAATDGVLITQAIITVSTYCVGLYTLTKESNGMNVAFILVEGVTVITVFLFLSCWYCNKLTQKCGDFITSAYMSDWTNWNKSQKKILLNLMTRTVSPVRFGGFLNVNMITLINVMKATFSYYNFLLAVLGNN